MSVPVNTVWEGGELPCSKAVRFLEAGVANFLAFLESIKEALERFIKTAQDVLASGKVKQRANPRRVPMASKRYNFGRTAMNSELQLCTVYEGDVFDLLRLLPDRSVDMVFSDPDYNIGVRYNGRSYRQRWDDYIDWYIRLAHESLRVLKDDGNAFFLNMPKQNAYLRVRYLDDACYDVHEYVWCYSPNVGYTPFRLTTAHRTILHARKQTRVRWYKDAIAQPFKSVGDKRVRERIEQGQTGRMPYDWFYFDIVKAGSREKTIHPCQSRVVCSSFCFARRRGRAIWCWCCLGARVPKWRSVTRWGDAG
jgi:hypothetical protein